MIGIILTLALLGVIVYFVTAFLPMPEPFKQVIIVIAAIFAILYLLRAFGLMDLPLIR